MRIEYIAQPDRQLGQVLSSLLESSPAPRRVIFVSAFVGLQTALRFRDTIAELREAGTAVRIVVGIDLGGTSQEVLREILSWEIDAIVVKNRIPRHTFHPKLYLIERTDKADIIIGSHNVTEGGFFRNYEGSAWVTYNLPADQDIYHVALRELQRFLEPTGSVTRSLTDALLARLVARGDVPTEVEARRNRDDSVRRIARAVADRVRADSPFGTEDMVDPPPLPPRLLQGLLERVRQRRREKRQRAPSPRRGAATRPPLMGEGRGDVIAPASFYMTLPTLQGRNIPGEGRIPLEAIELAQEFWGWPDEYRRDQAPRGGTERVYWNWRPIWKVWSVENRAELFVQPVRMYMYENSSDFRFYVRPLVRAGGNLGDVVRITRIAQPDAEYECVLARRHIPEYQNWLRFCTQPVRRNPDRRFGYA